LNSPADVWSYQKKDLNQAGEQLVTWKARNRWQYEFFVGDMTGLIVGLECNAITNASSIPVMVMAHMKSIALK